MYTHTGKWRNWMDTIEQTPVDPRKPFGDLIVPTPETVSYSWMIEHICTQMKHVLCIGPAGTGKTVTVKQKLMTAMDARFMPVFVTACVYLHTYMYMYADR